jgi:hypothetical protein
MSEMRELIDTELDAVCGGHHHHHHHHHEHYGQQGQQGQQGLFDFGNFGNINFGGNIVNFGNIVIQENIAVQIATAVGDNASATNLLGSQTNLSSITFEPLSRLEAVMGVQPH